MQAYHEVFFAQLTLVLFERKGAYRAVSGHEGNHLGQGVFGIEGFPSLEEGPKPFCEVVSGRVDPQYGVYQPAEEAIFSEGAYVLMVNTIWDGCIAFIHAVIKETSKPKGV